MGDVERKRRRRGKQHEGAYKRAWRHPAPERLRPTWAEAVDRSKPDQQETEQDRPGADPRRPPCYGTERSREPPAIR